MKEKARQQLVYIVAGVGILAAIYVQFGITVKKPDAALADPATTIQSATSLAVIATTPASAIGRPLVLAGTTGSTELPAGWGPDPFAPRQQRRQSGMTRINSSRVSSNSNMTEKAEPNWRLGGIIYLPTKPVAYVNDQAVHVGQIIDGALVTEITPRSVVMQFRGERKTLTLGKG